MDSTNRQLVTVRVFGSKIPSGGCGCSCGGGCCGSDGGGAEPPSQEEQARNLGTKLARYYGSSVRVDYIDLFSEAMASYPSEFQLITSRNLPLPLVTVNDEPMFAGGLPLEEITEAVEARGIRPVTDGQSEGNE